jgi:hypothetical protein
LRREIPMQKETVWAVEVGNAPEPPGPLENCEVVALFRKLEEAQRFVLWFVDEFRGMGARSLPYSVCDSFEEAKEETLAEEKA